MFLRRQFLERIAQTSEIPQGFEVESARGCYLFDYAGNAYLDLSSGFGVNNLGHGVEEVIDAIKAQAARYIHSTVYGEHIQSPQVQFAEMLVQLLPPNLNSVYFLNSGSEAIDAAMKLARLATGRPEIIVCRKAYHGSTLGAESLRSDAPHKAPFLPLLPGIRFIDFGNAEHLTEITSHTAAILTEVVQAEAGVRKAEAQWWNALYQKCQETGALFIADEVQTGLGRTGSLFAFMQTPCSPHILVAGKALGAGMPLSAVIASKELMSHFSKSLPLGQLTTFGGHPVSCAAALAGLKKLLSSGYMESVSKHGHVMSKHVISNPHIREIRSAGLLIALQLDHEERTMSWIRELYTRHRVLAESFLFAPDALRIAPPLCIEPNQLTELAHHLNELN